MAEFDAVVADKAGMFVSRKFDGGSD